MSESGNLPPYLQFPRRIQLKIKHITPTMPLKMLNSIKNKNNLHVRNAWGLWCFCVVFFFFSSCCVQPGTVLPCVAPSLGYSWLLRSAAFWACRTTSVDVVLFNHKVTPESGWGDSHVYAASRLRWRVIVDGSRKYEDTCVDVQEVKAQPKNNPACLAHLAAKDA